MTTMHQSENKTLFEVYQILKRFHFLVGDGKNIENKESNVLCTKVLMNLAIPSRYAYNYVHVELSFTLKIQCHVRDFPFF